MGWTGKIGFDLHNRHSHIIDKSTFGKIECAFCYFKLPLIHFSKGYERPYIT